MESKLEVLADMDVNVKVLVFTKILYLEYETKISIKYDHKNRTVSFYKNGNYQGIAFRNVAAGLYPSLDIWFESGTVEIMKNTDVQEKIFL